MKTEMKAVVASLVVIALALTAVSGVTYSWFSDEEKSTIDVSTVNIDIDGKYTGTPDMTGPYTSAEFVNNDKDLKIGGMVAGSSVTATYTLTNNSTVDVKYRMYLVVEGIDSATANGIVSITGDIESTSASPISFDSKGIAYVFGGKDFGIVLGSASGEPVIYPFTVKIALDTSLTSLPGFTVKIVNEAYQSDFEYSAPNFIKSDGSSALPKAAVTEDVIFKGTVPKDSSSSTAEPADAEVTFSPAAMNAATADGANDVTLKTEMLEPEGNIAKIRLTLVGAATTSFGADNWVTVSLKLSGEYTNVKVTYIGGEEQPVLISAAYDSDKDITTVVFKTNHFSEFVISNGAIVSTFDALKAAVEKGENVILDQDITFTSTVNIPAGKSIVVDFNGHKVTSEVCLFDMSPKTGSTLTINAVGSDVSADRIFNNYPSDLKDRAQTASLIMNGGNYATTDLGLLIFSMKYVELNDVVITSGAYATIWSGNSGVTDVVINGGKFVTEESVENSENVGIYLGSVRNSAKIVGAYIEGFIGLEIKSGKTVTVEECTIVGLGDYSEPMNINNNGSGSGVAPVMINNGYCEAAGITEGKMVVKFTGCTIEYSASSDKPTVVVVEKVGGIDIDTTVGENNIVCANEYSVGGVSFKTNAEKDDVA